MISKVFKQVLNFGVSDKASEQSSQRIRFTNTVALLYLVFIALILVVIFYQYGFKTAAKLVLFSSFIPLLSLFLNAKGSTIVSRYWISFSTPVFAIAISVLTKLNNEPGVTGFYEFFDTRMLVFISALIPLLIFSRKKIQFLLIALLPSALLLFFYDPIHYLFNVGYADIFEEPKEGYYIAALMFDIGYFFAIVGILALKNSNEKLVHNNALLIGDLHQKNIAQEKLLTRKQELLAQNKEVRDVLMKQHEELILKKKELEQASALINDQKNELQYKNKELTSKVNEKTRELKHANTELVAQNNGLLQFSNTVSHNLRAPVASLLGLVNLFMLEPEAKRKEEMIHHIKSSSVALDTIISDLNKVVDIRNQVFSLKEKFSLKEELDKISDLLKEQLKQSGVKLSIELEIDQIYSVRTNMQSILYNLVNNAIKYTNVEINGAVKIKSSIIKNDLVITVEDNGIGIDLEKFEGDLFKLYKRFHVHLEGKGMGLYIVKQQVEAMEGSISIKSKVMQGTTFVLKFPFHSFVEKQEYFKSKDAVLTYDAIFKTSILRWLQTPTSEKYRNILNLNKEMLAKYDSESWLIDIKKLGIIDKNDRNWFATKVLFDILKRGCKRIVLVRNDEDGKDFEYWQEMIRIANNSNVSFHFFYDYDVALEFIKSKNSDK